MKRKCIKCNYNVNNKCVLNDCPWNVDGLKVIGYATLIIVLFILAYIFLG